MPTPPTGPRASRPTEKPKTVPPLKKLNTQDVTLTFGKHKGERIQRVPVHYLTFMVRNGTAQANYAQAELDRRGTTIPEIQVSGHAIDSASLRLLETWKSHREATEGLNSWLCRSAWAAWCMRESPIEKEVTMLGIVWCFDLDGAWPVLLTVKPAREPRS